MTRLIGDEAGGFFEWVKRWDATDVLVQDGPVGVGGDREELGAWSFGNGRRAIHGCAGVDAAAAVSVLAWGGVDEL